MNRILIIFSLIMLLHGCTSQKLVKTGEETEKDTMGLVNENFDPLILKDEDLVIKKNKPAEAKSDYNDSIIMNLDETATEEKEVSGYRVQICAVSSVEAARETQREAILKLNEDIYLIYDSPYYKVRIGNCTTRYEADRLQNLAVSKGFAEAWVVKTKVNLKAKSQNDENLNSQPTPEN